MSAPRGYDVACLPAVGSKSARWLKVLRLEDYAPRRSRPEALQETLFPYHEAWG